MPQLLPGGDAVLFTIKTKTISSFSEARIAVQRIGTKEKKVLMEGGAGARYIATGHLLYAQGPSLFLVPFDPVSLELKGPAEMILDSAGMLNESFGYFTGVVSEKGTLVYAPGGPLPVVKNHLTMYDRAGRVVPFLEVGGRLRPVLDQRRPEAGGGADLRRERRHLDVRRGAPAPVEVHVRRREQLVPALDSRREGPGLHRGTGRGSEPLHEIGGRDGGRETPRQLFLPAVAAVVHPGRQDPDVRRAEQGWKRGPVDIAPRREPPSVTGAEFPVL